MQANQSVRQDLHEAFDSDITPSSDTRADFDAQCSGSDYRLNGADFGAESRFGARRASALVVGEITLADAD